jgi:aspartate/methionine/tyrosine aminotransferase
MRRENCVLAADPDLSKEASEMPNQKEVQKLALQGGLRAVTQIEGKGKPKIGVDEFMAIAGRFGFSSPALKKIRAVVAAEDMEEGPFLANYYSDLKETCVQAFERAARETFGAKYAIGVSSGTAALHCALVAAGVGPGKEVLCPAIGFFATAAAVVQASPHTSYLSSTTFFLSFSSLSITH